MLSLSTMQLKITKGQQYTELKKLKLTTMTRNQY